MYFNSYAKQYVKICMIFSQSKICYFLINMRNTEKKKKKVYLCSSSPNNMKKKQTNKHHRQTNNNSVLYC